MGRVIPDINAAVLAGGMSKRFGQEKAMLKFGDLTLLERIYSEIISIVSKCWVIGRKREGLNLHPDLFVDDIVIDAGPMGGLFTGLNLSDKPLFLTSCDMPFIKKEHIQYIIEQFDPKLPATIAVSESGKEPLFGLYQKNVLPIIERLFSNKSFAMYHIFDHIEVKFIDFAKTEYMPEIFFNINTLSDYKKALYLRSEFNRIK